MIRNSIKIEISETTKELLINKLLDELVFLRTKLGLSQDELSNVLGVSRQTYSTLETRRRPMSWGTYLALIMIFDNCEQTHDIVRNSGMFPYFLFGTSEMEKREKSGSGFSDLMTEEIRNRLDEQAFHAIETVIMLEYARCNNMTGDAVIRAFDGKKFVNVSERDMQISRALGSIRAGLLE